MFKVLQPTAIGKMEIRNRFMRSATHDSSADPSGAVTDSSVQLYEKLAAGGVGLIVTGHAFIATSGQAAIGQFGIYGDEMIPGLRRLTDGAHKHGAKIAVQVSHCGITSPYLNSKGIVAMAASEIQGRQPHRAMDNEEVEAMIDAYVAAGIRAREAGFDAIQLHGAHGYQMSQFFSPITNCRADRWGGNSENRRRFHIETIRRVRAAVGADFPILMKFGIADDSEGGATLEEGIAAVKAMTDAGLDSIEISGGISTGKLSPIRIVNDDINEITYYRERAARAKKVTDIPIALVGGIRRLETAEGIVASGDADLISLSRALIREPGLINRWLEGDTRRATCISCNKCLGIMRGGRVVECGEDLRIREERETSQA